LAATTETSTTSVSESGTRAAAIVVRGAMRGRACRRELGDERLGVPAIDA
jgi:hypothetical protein